MVEMRARGVGQQALTARLLDDRVLHADHIGQRLEKKTHRVARLQGRARKPLVGREHRGFHGGHVGLGKASFGQQGQIRTH